MTVKIPYGVWRCNPGVAAIAVQSYKNCTADSRARRNIVGNETARTDTATVIGRGKLDVYCARPLRSIKQQYTIALDPMRNFVSTLPRLYNVMRTWCRFINHAKEPHPNKT